MHGLDTTIVKQFSELIQTAGASRPEAAHWYLELGGDQAVRWRPIFRVDHQGAEYPLAPLTEPTERVPQGSELIGREDGLIGWRVATEHPVHALVFHGD
jgi:hypothetical protein